MIDAGHDENPPEMRCLVAIRGRWIASVSPNSKAVQRAAVPKSCFAVHSFEPALRWPCLPRKFRLLTACRTADFFAGPAGWGMIRKSGNRFSEKIMLKERDEIMIRFDLIGS
jgi:hypothetical protein